MRAIVFLILVCISQFSFAKINYSKNTIELSVDAKLNQNPIGRLTLVVDPNDKLSLKWSELEPWLVKILLPEAIKTLNSKVNNGIVEKSVLEKLGYTIIFDMSDFSLAYIVPFSLIRPQNISLKSGSRNLNPIEPAKFSGFINAYTSYLHQQDEEEKSASDLLAIRSELVLNLNGWVLENEGEYLSERTARSSSFKRLGTRIIHDLPLNGMRISVGDNYSSGSYFQTNSQILGVAISRDFSLVSDRQIRPSASRSFTLESPSSVEVLVAGRIVQKLNLAAGIYSLDDIPLNEGNNDITLKITDIAGVTRLVDFSITTGLELFAQGQLEYELYVGVPSYLGKRLDYDYKKPLASFYLDYGITPSWTAGLTAQADEYSQQIGYKNIYAAKIGQIAFENAVSFSDKIGHAYRLVYSNYRNSNKNNKDLTIGYEYSSRDFTSLGYRPDAQLSSQTRQHYLQANYSFVTNKNLQASFYSSLSRAYDKAQFEKSIGLSIAGDIDLNQWRYNLSGQWEEVDNKNQLGFRLSISYKFNNSQRAKLSHQTRRDKTRLEFMQDSNQRYVGALNLRAGFEKNDQNEAVFDLNTQYNANRFVMNLDHGSFYEQLNENKAYHQSRLSIASSIAFANDSWGIGKPIYDSFALVKPHSSLQGKKVTLGEYAGDYRANNSDFETILLSDINSYSSSNITVDIEDLAPGYDIGSGMLTFYSPYRTGHSVTIGTAANISVVATLLYKDNKPLSLQVGTAICTDNSSNKEYTFFTNKKGRFALTGLTPCKYSVTIKNAENSKFEIEVSEGEQLQRKGSIYVQ